MAAAFLVSVPVFIQAPLVRVQPWVSLAMTLLWIVSGFQLLRYRSLELWGDLAIGFSWTWLAGSIYWGWLRENPYIHLPIEAIGLPIVLILISQKRLMVGSYFYLGSLLGTAITDLYFYWVNLLPYWKQAMQVEPAAVGPVLHNALLEIQNPIAAIRAMVLLTILMLMGSFAMKEQHTHSWAFAGAVLSTILVDALFLAAATLA
ncbi:DUF3120 domain-containing protein [Leptothoe kymatousa]|uniref:DUF3120 domain-containing protein n=1 Tax=Leptothoe kymatousa TaxID=2651727 RepID=UPI001FE7B476|nr:DUF3120 domain-containing protein [Leptothoe kymatousa]